MSAEEVRPMWALAWPISPSVMPDSVEMPTVNRDGTSTRMFCLDSAFDKVTVWDSMNGGSGTPATANFLSGMLKAIPPMNELFRQAGMELPPMLGSDLPDAPVRKEAQSEPVETEPAAVEA